MSEDAEERADRAEDDDVSVEGDMEDLRESDPAGAFEQAGGVPGTHMRAMEFWDDIISDMEATAAEYEAEGWETHLLHPGDVSTLTPDSDSDMFGLDVLVPNNEFDEVEDLLEGGAAFDSYEAYRAVGDGLVLLVVAMEDHDEKIALLYPAYYDPQNATEMIGAAGRAGEMRTYLRTLTNERIEFIHDEPENFGPPAGQGEGEE